MSNGTRPASLTRCWSVGQYVNSWVSRPAVKRYIRYKMGDNINIKYKRGDNINIKYKRGDNINIKYKSGDNININYKREIILYQI